MFSLINKYKVISIIGMAKNVGKTTTLNFILKNSKNSKKIGLTSIGRDGEQEDVVTKTKKPMIYIHCGTIIATTRHCLNQSDFTKKIIETTNIHTPLGEVIIVEALSDGYVDLAGPSMNEHLKRIIKIFNKNHVELTLIDGAISRKGFASDEISDACILCTGAAYSSQMEKVIQDTEHIVHLFNLKNVSKELKNTIKSLNAPVSLIDKDGSINSLNIKTALNASKQVVYHLNKESEYLVLKGALTDDLIKAIIENRSTFSKLTIVVTHPTKCLFKELYSEQMKLANIQIQVLNQTKLLCVTINPSSPYGYYFDNDQFKANFNIKLPIFNVMSDSYE